MTIPAVMFIEAAIDSVGGVVVPEMIAEIKEFRMLGTRIDAFHPLPHLTDIERGYLLGLQVARTILETMPAAIQAGVKL